MSECIDNKIGKYLHAYELGKLSDEHAESFELHLLDCKHCFGEVQKFEKVAEIMADDADVRFALREAAVEKPGPESLWAKLLRYIWPNTNLVLRPALSYFAIIMLIYPAYLGIRNLDDGQVRPVQILNLIPERSLPEPVKAGDDLFVSFVFPDARAGQSYSILIKDENSGIVYEDSEFEGFSEFGLGGLLLPSAKLKPGNYSLTIEDRDGAPPFNKQDYSFKIE